MKNYIIALLMVIFTYTINYGQQNTSTTITAKWENSYNSILNIESFNKISRYFTGTYGSHTGASGKYRVIGFVGTSKADGSTPITLTIHWKPITGSKGTSDEKMTSIMTGQIYLDTQTNQYKMELFHNLNQPTPYGRIVSDFQTPGNYTETLIFTVNGPATTDPEWDPSPIISSDFTGVWHDDNSNLGTLQDEINIIAISADNVVQATYKSTDGELYLLKGFIGDSDSNTAKSVSLVGINSKDNTVLSFSGLINKANNGSDFYYDAIYVKGRPTGYGDRYSSVKIEGLLMAGPKNSNETLSSVELQQQRIPLTNNGASEWISSTQIGSQQGENLKFAVDTGGNFNWANSVQCTSNSCTGFGHNQFNQTNSTSFEWIDQTINEVKWGPWGKAYANLGKDIIHFTSDENIKNDLRLITDFPDNTQFNEFLWDGAIALPSNTSSMLGGMSNFVARLISAGKIIPHETFPVSFYTNTASKSGKIQIGSVDSTIYDQNSKVILPFNPYPQVGYLWTTSLHSFDLDGKTFKTLPYYSIDSGSSALKGDSTAMSAAYNYAVQKHATSGKYPNMNFQMGTLEATGEIAKLTLTSDQYVPLIEEGEHKGEHVPQIQTLNNVDGLLVQGSTLMNSVYTVFVYETRINPASLDVELFAKEMWLYNKKNGPKIIQHTSDTNPSVELKRNQNSNQIKVNPNPLKENLTITFDSKTQEKIHIKVVDMTGRTIYKISKNTQLGTNIFNLKNVIKTSKKNSNQIVILFVENSSGTINFEKKMLIE